MARTAVHDPVPPKGTEKLATEVPEGGARLPFCHEHVTFSQRKEKKNQKKALNSKWWQSPPLPPTHREIPPHTCGDRTGCFWGRAKSLVWWWVGCSCGLRMEQGVVPGAEP